MPLSERARTEELGGHETPRAAAICVGAVLGRHGHQGLRGPQARGKENGRFKWSRLNSQGWRSVPLNSPTRTRANP